MDNKMKLKPCILPLILFAILLASIITQNIYLANIAMVMAWLKIILFVVMSILVFVGYAMSLASKSTDDSVKQEKTHRFNRALLILIQVADILLMASMGWIITAIVYAVGYAFLMLLTILIKAVLKEKI